MEPCYEGHGIGGTARHTAASVPAAAYAVTASALYVFSR
jgi:hypothetical protein